jgi:hypothetical protein
LEAATREPLVEGSKGQLRANPLYAVAERCDRLALDLGQELRKLRRLRERDDEMAPFRGL